MLCVGVYSVCSVSVCVLVCFMCVGVCLCVGVYSVLVCVMCGGYVGVCSVCVLVCLVCVGVCSMLVCVLVCWCVLYVWCVYGVFGVSWYV